MENNVTKLEKQIVFYISDKNSGLDKTVLTLYFDITSEEDRDEMVALGIVLYKVMSDLTSTNQPVSMMFQYKNENLEPCMIALSNIIGITTDIVAPKEVIDQLHIGSADEVSLFMSQ